MSDLFKVLIFETAFERKVIGVHKVFIRQFLLQHNG